MLIVVDTDPGVDDAFALVGLLARARRGDCRVLAIGTVHGNLPPAPGADNALRITELLEMAVPVAVGAAKPLVGPEMQSGQIVHGEDGLGGNAGPKPRATPTAESAADQLVRLTRTHPGEITVLALGPLTNLALALAAEPALPTLVKNVVWMGGVFDRPGTVGIVQEPNAWHDPEAAEQVLAAGFALTVVPIDAVEQAWADEAWLAELAGVDHPVARALTAWHKQYLDFYSGTAAAGHGGPGMLLYDPVAAAIALNPELGRYERHEVVVELQGYLRGATLVDRRAAPLPGTELPARRPVQVAVGADSDRILADLLADIAGLGRYV
ncbi:nucleoside hydrolase [Kutzneria sp. CA-103260]|uniref:nucleoside hydrolase n=1 Tax=Kutzneria sp. CA-103260 TaxID=2802641 RepID=UPI001BA99325|nr:nucleoside hydrolase [Kutzneria sp. CA-103260]QUQ68378.1 purine nucleosidase [Kutzneria sp. CA-103260]